MAVRIVGIGASAGGLQALETFFSEVPPGLGLAFVVVQHLSMDHATSITAILQRSTALKVVSLDEMTVPQPDHVYVKMPHIEVQVEAQVLRTIPRHTEHENLYLPIDDFFFTLASSRREDAVAIVLSGMGTDGSRGLQEIKERGGLVLVQHPDSAQFDGMPRAALRQNLADVVLPPAELASRLAMIVGKRTSGIDVNQNLERFTHKEVLKVLLDRIHATSGVDFNRYRPATIIRRIEKRMLIRQYDSFPEYIAHALDNQEELQILRQSFLIGVTRFFRDREAFDVVAKEAISELFSQDTDREIRIWVPACSTGEEVYSLAIMIDDHIIRHQLDVSYRIFGSDVDRAAIITAAAGVYPESIAADIPAEWLSRYFVRENNGYKVVTDLKEKVLFAVQNLLEDPPFIRLDLISCRNFLIYVNGEAQQRIIGNFHFSLNPSGVLMLGPSETLGSLTSAFSTLNRRWKVYRKRPGGKTTSGKLVSPSIDNISSRPGGIRIMSAEDGKTPDIKLSAGALPAASQQIKMDHFSRYLSERFAPATLFVNRAYDILYLNGDFQGILRLPRFNAHLSLQTVVSDEVESLLITGVAQVMRTGKTGHFERINVADSRAEPRWVKVRFSLHDFSQYENSVAMIEFYPADETGNGMEVSDSGEVYSVDRQLKNKIKELENELMRSEQRAQKLYNELEATNEELQSSNRELLASNEEMQSTNEELQSVNEELYTVNNEFQRKNEELNDINNDVSNLLKSTQISTIFVDSKLRIRRFTPAIVQQFDLHASDLGRPITSFSNTFENLDIEQLCKMVLENNVRHDQELQDRFGNYYLLRMLPYMTDQEQVEGIVITFVDINDLARTRRRLTDLALKYEAIFNNTNEVIAVVRENSRIEELNQPLAGRSRKDLVGSYFTDLIATDADKVLFNEGLRAAFDEREVSNLDIKIIDTDAEALYIKIEILPISFEGDFQVVVNDNVSQAMVIIQDLTLIELERREAGAVIEQYQKALSYLQQDAGLLDMDERLIVVNHMPTHVRNPEEYPNQRLDQFLSEKGLEKYRKACRRLKEGSGVESVIFDVDDLLDDSHPRQVLYRPIIINGSMQFVSFEVVSNTGQSAD